MNDRADLVYGFIMILMSFLLAVMYVRDYKKGIYEPKFTYIASGGYLLHLIVVLSFVISFYSISNLFLEKIFAISALAILGAVINALNHKTYSTQQKRKIITDTIRMDCGFILLSLFIGFSNF
jgi:hypothetical protein